MNKNYIEVNNESYVSVELKGYLDGLRLIIDSDASIAEIELAIKQTEHFSSENVLWLKII